MKADKQAVWEGLQVEYEQMNAAPFAAIGLTYEQAGLEDSYTEDSANEEGTSQTQDQNE